MTLLTNGIFKEFQLTRVGILRLIFVLLISYILKIFTYFPGNKSLLIFLKIFLSIISVNTNETVILKVVQKIKLLYRLSIFYS